LTPRNNRSEFWGYLAPPLFWFLIFLVVPLILIVIYSFSYKELYGGVNPGFTFESYSIIFRDVYFTIFIKSFLITTAATILTILLGYPVAYYLAFSKSKIRYLFLVLIVLPLWLNFLIKIFSFITIFGENGVLNQFLMALSIIDKPLPLLNNLWSLITGFLYINLPFFILPVFASLDKLDQRYIEASLDLGATPVQTFFRIILPQSVPGLMAGVVFTFIPTLSNFLVPEFLGGVNNYMLGNLITSQFLQARNWPFGSALSMILIFMVVFSVSLYLRYYGNTKNNMLSEF